MNELEDADSADILTEVSRGVDKRLWFVEAHQQGALAKVDDLPGDDGARSDGARAIAGPRATP
jgi:starvation-inducible DNA-binding protein